MMASLIRYGSYLIGAGWGQVSRGMIEKHRTLLAQANAAGNLRSIDVAVDREPCCN
jgi:hypothetical protein